MGEPKCVLSDAKYKNRYLDMIEECKDDIKVKGFEILVPISDNITFENDIAKLLDLHEGSNLPDGWVSASTFWLIDDLFSKVLGVVSVRHDLTEQLRFRGGHIAYYVRPSERRKGYATNMLTFALDFCRKLGIERVLITCSKDNVYSKKVIQNNGGIFDSEDIEDGHEFQRYWFNL